MEAAGASKKTYAGPTPVALHGGSDNMSCKIFSFDPHLGKETHCIVDNLDMALASVCADLNTRNDVAIRIECSDGTVLNRADIVVECARRKKS
jgi:hypothetical protein